MIHRVSGRALLLAALAGTAFVLWPRSPAPGQVVGEIIAPPHHGKPPVEFVGAASCSSVACHNFGGPKGSSRSEFGAWSDGDKHNRAFVVLENHRSARIMLNLRGPDAPHATKEPLCLKCHSTNDGRCDNASERFTPSDGVSCEACHGPAHKYLTAHYKEGFKQLPEAIKLRDFGLWPTKNLGERTRICSSCHVGDSSREVNHDLIAAGHPRLNFEAASYHGIYCDKHWSDESEKCRHPDFYARIWLVGQLAAARSAADLLVSRADGSLTKPEDKAKPWPEFSEYSCAACHKNLEVDSPRQLAGFGGRFPGSFPFGGWYLESLRPLNGDTGIVPKSLYQNVQALTAVMQKPAVRAQDASAVASKLSAELDSVIHALDKTKPFDADQVRGFMRALIDDALTPTGRKIAGRAAVRIDALDWDGATQLYLGLAALAQQLSSYKTKDGFTVKPDLEAIRLRLRVAFPYDSDSPSRYDPLERPEKGQLSLKQHLESIRSLLGS